MTQPLPPTSTPTTVAADARNRALRTAAQGLVIDITAAVVLAIAPAIFDAHFAWSRAWWATVGLLAGKTAIQTGLSYLMRRMVPPTSTP